MAHELLTGLDVPEPLGRGRPDPEKVEPWLELTEQLMGRGVYTPGQLQRVLGVGYKTANRWLTTVRKRWSASLTRERQDWRREKLYNEAEAVARAAWLDALTTAQTASEKASLYKVVLMANQRKAALTGLDSFEVRVEARVTSHQLIDVVSRVEQEHGLAPGALEAIGRDAAQLLSSSVTIDAETCDPVEPGDG